MENLNLRSKAHWYKHAFLLVEPGIEALESTETVFFIHTQSANSVYGDYFLITDVSSNTAHKA